jgi:hypothetical protein
MRRQCRQLWLVTLFALCLLPAAGRCEARRPAPPPSETAYPYVVGLGAIAGIVITQAVLFGPAGFPFAAGSVVPGAAIAAEVSVGISRIYAITSAVTGAWVANWLYDH